MHHFTFEDRVHSKPKQIKLVDYSKISIFTFDSFATREKKQPINTALYLFVDNQRMFELCCTLSHFRFSLETDTFRLCPVKTQAQLQNT